MYLPLSLTDIFRQRPRLWCMDESDACGRTKEGKKIIRIPKGNANVRHVSAPWRVRAGFRSPIVISAQLYMLSRLPELLHEFPYLLDSEIWATRSHRCDTATEQSLSLLFTCPTSSSSWIFTSIGICQYQPSCLSPLACTKARLLTISVWSSI